MLGPCIHPPVILLQLIYRSGHPANYLLLLKKLKFVGARCPHIILFTFCNIYTTAQAVFHCKLHVFWLPYTRASLAMPPILRHYQQVSVLFFGVGGVFPRGQPCTSFRSAVRFFGIGRALFWGQPCVSLRSVVCVCVTT